MQTPSLARRFPKSPEQEAGFFSRLVFQWVQPLMTLGNEAVPRADGAGLETRSLEQADLYPLVDDDAAQKVSREFEAAYSRHRAAGSPKAVFEGLKEIFWWTYVSSGILKFCNSTLQFAPSIILSGLLTAIEAQSGYASSSSRRSPIVDREDVEEDWNGYVWAVALFVALVIRTGTENQYFNRIMRLGFSVRTAITTAVYRKALRLSPAARQGTSIGGILNLMQIDASRLDGACFHIHVLWDGFYQIIGYMVILYVFVGPSAFAGLGAMLVVVPVNAFFMIRMGRIRRAAASITDRRIKLTNETLQGIRAIKLYNWEIPFMRMIGDVRDEELAQIRSAGCWNLFANTLMMMAPYLVGVVTLIVFSATGGEMAPSTIFASLQVIQQLQFPLMFIPMALDQTTQARVSLGRLESFMRGSEVHRAALPAPGQAVAVPVAAGATEASAPVPEAERGIRVTSGTFFWVDPDAEFTPLLQETKPPATPGGGGGGGGGGGAGGAGAAGGAGRGAGAAASPASSPTASSGTESAADTDAEDTDTGADGSASTKAKKKRARPVLSDVNLTVRPGELVAVIGTVGAGKSALCSALLGELHQSVGEVSVKGRVAYVAQSAWILNATLRDNILFGRPMDDAKYQRIIDVCQLRQDLATLPHGDKTEIGERGINLSGGQKQRVSIARAAYSDSDIFIFDDPLSALDAEVGRALFEQCIVGELRGSTRLLITNQMHVLEHCDSVAVLERGRDRIGRVSMAGAYADLMHNPAFVERVHGFVRTRRASSLANDDEHARSAAADGSGAGAGSGAGSGAGVGGATAPAPTATGSTALASSSPTSEGVEVSAGDVTLKDDASKTAEATPGSGDDEIIRGDSIAPSPVTKTASDSAEGATTVVVDAPTAKEGGAPKAPAPKGQLVAAEGKETGAVQLKYYLAYFRSGPCWVGTIIGLLLAACVAQLCMLSSSFWVSTWSNDVEYENFPRGVYMGVYAALAVGSALLGMVRTGLFTLTGIAASRRMHHRLLDTVVYAPMAFFDTTPLGRLLSRFSKDMEQLDTLLPGSLAMLALMLFLILGTLTAIVFTTPWFAIAIVPIFFVYTKVMNYFRTVSREVKRHEAVSRSPIYTHFSETLNGLSTIRAYNRESDFAVENERRVDLNVANWYTLKSLDRWLSVRLESIGNIIVFTSAVLTVATSVAGDRSGIAGLAGFSLAYSLSITGVLNWTVRTGAEVENQMNSVERLVGTIDTTPSEPRNVNGTLPESWPSRGAVEFDDYRLRYRQNSPEVLHGVSFAVGGGEKVGIVGRSGAGKSSLMVALFRIIEDACKTGAIRIDGVDINSVGLSQLRSRLAIIPQEPIMFSGTVRTNLDPIGQFRGHENEDERFWTALQKVGLQEVVQALEGGLDAPVSEFGENFSVGQRQLICLARVLLRDCRVVLLDEATSSVDPETDRKMQEIIRTEFADRTILTIAHRLHTIISADKVVVMSEGRVAEFDHPHRLLSRSDSVFAALVEETGNAAPRLRELAAKSFRAKHGSREITSA